MIARVISSGKWITVTELYPGYALYRGIAELGDYAVKSSRSGVKGMTWKDVSDSTNGMKEVLIIMLVESIVGVFVAYYFDQVFSSGSGKSPLFFLKGFQKKSPMSFHKLTMKRQGSKASAQTEKSDVVQEVNFTYIEYMYTYYCWNKRIRKLMSVKRCISPTGFRNQCNDAAY